MTRFSTGRLISRHRRGWLLVAVGTASLLAACQSKPSGQVVASVNGDEITLTELNTELSSMQIPPGADKKMVQQAALQRIIERKLLANAAKQDGIDQNPEFIVRRQALEDTLLAQMLAKKLSSGIKNPAPAAIDKYMADNPNMFAGRVIYAVDQISFDTPKRDDFLKQLAATHTMPDVVGILDKLQVKYQRQNATIDSAMVPAPMLAQIRAVPAGEPFVVPLGNKIVVSLITDSKPAPQTGDQVRPYATNAVKNLDLAKLLQTQLATEKGKAKIEYQPGFAPPPPGAAGKPGAAAPAK